MATKSLTSAKAKFSFKNEADLVKAQQMLDTEYPTLRSSVSLMHGENVLFVQKMSGLFDLVLRSNLEKLGGTFLSCV